MQRVQGSPPSQRALACRHASHPSTHCSAVRPFLRQCPHGLDRVGECEMIASMRMSFFLPRVVASGFIVPTAVQIAVSGWHWEPQLSMCLPAARTSLVRGIQHRLRRFDADLPLTFTARLTKPMEAGHSAGPECEARNMLEGLLTRHCAPRYSFNTIEFGHCPKIVKTYRPKFVLPRCARHKFPIEALYPDTVRALYISEIFFYCAKTLWATSACCSEDIERLLVEALGPEGIKFLRTLPLPVELQQDLFVCDSSSPPERRTRRGFRF
jgi:hypothetical protein